MKFQFTEKKVSLPASLHAYAEKKVMKLERFFGEDADALVAFSIEKNKNNVEITVHAANTYFRASESTSDMFASIDAAVSTIERQIRKNKTRLAKKLKKDSTLDNTLLSGSSYTGGEDKGEFEVVKTKRFIIKPMSVEEAILQMNLLGHSFFIFKNMESNEVNIVYKRRDKKYAVIESIE